MSQTLLQTEEGFMMKEYRHTHARTHARTHTEAIVIIAGICCIFRNSVHYTRNKVFL